MEEEEEKLSAMLKKKTSLHSIRKKSISPEHSLLSLLKIYRQIVFWVSWYNSAMFS